MSSLADGSIPRPASVRPVPLGELATGRGTVLASGASSDVAVTGITASSGRVHPGDLFAALPGRAAHGASYATAALDAGAAALLTDEAGRSYLPAGVATLVVPDVRRVLGPLSADVYGRPSTALTMLGVTGTSGKTTTTFLLRAALRAAGLVTGLIGTVATMIGDDEIKTGFTTPEAPDVQALLAVMRDRGVTHVAMEVSSHALAMYRADGIRFDVSAFTNLSEDHLDFHTDMDDYFVAKARLFSDLTHRSVVVVDDEWGRRIAATAPNCSTVSTNGDLADWAAFDIVDQSGGGTVFRLGGTHGARTAALTAGCAIPGRYNVANAALAIAMSAEIGLPAEAAAHSIQDATVPGRMEPVDAGQPFLAVVDYSHKPAAVEGALRALRPLTRGRLIIVLGCGGDRDRGKRPHMGEIAARGADLLIVTDDNPRSEDPADIRRAMLDGALAIEPGSRGEVVEVGDRAAAIAAGVAAAGPGDTLLIAGKGHETGQEIAGRTHPFDDRVELRDQLDRR